MHMDNTCLASNVQTFQIGNVEVYIFISTERCVPLRFRYFSSV